MKSIVTIVAFSLFSLSAFSQSASQSQTARQSTGKQTSSQTTTVTNTNKAASSNTERITGAKTWYYCPVCGHKYATIGTGKCPNDGTELVTKTIK